MHNLLHVDWMVLRTQGLFSGFIPTDQTYQLITRMAQCVQEEACTDRQWISLLAILCPVLRAWGLCLGRPSSYLALLSPTAPLSL